jgi:hypothetical protein
MSDSAPVLQTVKITITEVPVTTQNPSGIAVSQDIFQVSKARDAASLQVEWICGSSGFAIEFKRGDSPFAESQFRRSTAGSLLSGRVRNEVQPDDHLPHSSRKNYLYSVRIGNRVLDPGGVVNG